MSEKKYWVIIRSCILLNHFPIPDEELPNWDVMSLNEHLRSYSIPLAVVTRMIRSLILIEAPAHLHKLALKSFSFDLLDTMIWLSSSYSIILDAEINEKGINVSFEFWEKITPFDNISKKSKLNQLYGKGTAVFSTNLPREWIILESELQTVSKMFLW